jgi:hypothetical protein
VGKAHTTASLETILIPTRSGKVEKDFVVCEDMLLVARAEGPIKQKPVTIPNRRIPESDELFETISVRYRNSPHMERLRHRD